MIQPPEYRPEEPQYLHERADLWVIDEVKPTEGFSELEVLYLAGLSIRYVIKISVAYICVCFAFCVEIVIKHCGIESLTDPKSLVLFPEKS